MTKYINSVEYFAKFKTILELATAASILTAAEVSTRVAAVDKNMAWSDKNFALVEAWLNERLPMPDSTSTKLPDTTTQGSNSVIASTALLLFCSFVMSFV